MNFKEWFFQEAINVPPHLPGKWFRDILAKAEQIEARLKDAKQIVKQANKYEKEYGNNYRFIEDLWDDIPYELRSLLEEEKFYYRQPISDRIKEWFKTQKIEGLAPHTLKHFRNRIDAYQEWRRVPDFMKRYSEIFKKEKYYQELYEVLKDSDIGEEALQTIKKSEEIFKAIYDYIILAREIHNNNEAFKEREDIHAQKYYGGEEVKPKHSQFEILYHATPFVKEILASGFKTKEEIGREVLGGATEGISFTADIKIAKAIAEAIITVIRIAKGELKIPDIMRMFKSEKISLQKSNWPLDYRQYLMRKKVGGSKDYFTGEIEEPFGSRIHDDPRHHVFELYRNMLIRSNLKYDPLFFGVRVNDFENLDQNNAGIIAAKIDMSKVVRYLISMEEFRVPKEAILQYWRVN